MNKNVIFSFLKKHSSTILSCIASGGVIATGILSARGTANAIDQITKETIIKKSGYEELSNKEKAKILVASYILPVSVGIGTIVCIFGSNMLNKKQQATMASAYALLSSSFQKYKDEVKERYGEEVHRDIITKVSSYPVDQEILSVDNDLQITNVSFGFPSSLDFDHDEETCLFYDVFSNRYFESTVSKVLQAQYAFNRNFVLRGEACLDEWYEFLGIEPTPESHILGWSFMDELYWIDFNNFTVEIEDGDNGLKCNYVEFVFGPTEDYLDTL